ncbi:MAG: DinB family protein [Ignavibacteriales bacterium]|nr:DinB family protein [Ignavibacteriales bacterium]
MVQRTKWFERTFDFNFPVGVFPSLLERLRGTPARLEELVRSFPQEILTKRRNGGWSIQEHAGHLYDLEELHFGRLDDYDAGVETLRSADLKNQKTENANHNAQPVKKLLELFRHGRLQFVHRLEAMDEKKLVRSSVHPRLKKPMRVVDFALFVAEHDDHHLASITGLAVFFKAH